MGRGVGREDAVKVEDGVVGGRDDTAAAGGGGAGMFVRSKYPSVGAPEEVLRTLVPASELTVVAEEKSTAEADCWLLVLFGKLLLCAKKGSSSGEINMASSEAAWTRMGCTGGSISGGSSCS